MTWLSLLVAGWVGFGLGMAFTAYVLLTAHFMVDRIHIEKDVKSPQRMLAEWL